MNAQRREPLSWQQRPVQELGRLAWPIGVSMVSYSVMTFVDTLFVSRLGSAALAGVGLGGVVAFTLSCFGFGLLRAIKVLVSQCVGAGRTGRVARVLGAGLLVAAGFGLATILVGRLGSPLLSLVTATGASADHARAYLDVRVLGAPLFLVAVALREGRNGLGDVRSPMRAALVANFANIVLDYLLIFHFDAGVAGAARASAIAHAIDATCLALVQRRFGFGLGRAALRELRPLWRLGVPLGLQMMLEVTAFAMLTVMFSGMSEADMAAHQIALQAIHLSFLPALAIGEAASVMVGQAVGADRDELVPRVAWLTLGIASIYTGLCAAGMALGAGVIAGAFSSDPTLTTKTVHLLYVAAAFQLFDGANIVSRCVLRGTGDVRYAAVVAVVAAWLVTPPLTLALGYGCGLGVLGGWIGFCLEIMVGAAILWRRLIRRKWHAAAARAREELDAEPVSQPLPSHGERRPLVSPLEDAPPSSRPAPMLP